VRTCLAKDKGILLFIAMLEPVVGQVKGLLP
jgi:hypothetical protein